MQCKLEAFASVFVQQVLLLSARQTQLLFTETAFNNHSSARLPYSRYNLKSNGFASC